MKRSATKWLLLVALAWSQLTFAAHQFEHTAADLEEPCAVCIQFDRDDDTTLDADKPQSPTSQKATVNANIAIRDFREERVANYRSRASP